MKSRILPKAIENSQKLTESCLNSKLLRMDENAFTRKRKLGAKRILHMILNKLHRALQLHLDEYYDTINESPVSKQAFSKARSALNPEYVRCFADMTAELAAADDTMPCYRKMRLIAIDGSDVALENSSELKEAFGCSGPKSDAATALCSIAYGPLDHVIYDCRIDKYKTDERDLARLHVDRLTQLGLQGSLLLFDRWYPSAEFIAFLHESGYPFVMRVRRKWSVAVDMVKTQGKLAITHNGKEYFARVLKVALPTGEVETLLTSLSQKQLPIRNAGALYFQRWAVETAFDLIKSKLQLENFSGKTKISVLQDFYAAIYLANISAFAAGEADAVIADADSGKSLKYFRKANRNRTIYGLRKDFLSLLMEPDPAIRDVVLQRLIDYVAQRPISVVSNRTSPRSKPRIKRFHVGRKAVL